ncbi:MAG TPA: hypothetical protein PKU69_05370 [Bacillota bacterium]|nr:hypothetical protein [Bacillota bacterium]HPJ23657.1 hypothetical protein [Bacillota bacterium]
MNTIENKQTHSMNLKRTKQVLAIVAIISFLMMSTNLLGFNIDAGFSSFDMLDVKFHYTAGEFYVYFSELTNEMSIAYLNLHLMDYVFIFSFYPLLAMIIWGMTIQTRKSIRFVFVTLPLVAMFSDLFENILIDVEMLSSTIFDTGMLAGFFTTLKFSALAFSVIYIIYKLLLSRKR